MKCKKCKSKLRLIKEVSYTTSYEIDDNFNMMPYDNLDSSEEIYFQCSECGTMYNIKDNINTYTQLLDVGKLFLKAYGDMYLNNGTELLERDINLEERQSN